MRVKARRDTDSPRGAGAPRREMETRHAGQEIEGWPGLRRWSPQASRGGPAAWAHGVRPDQWRWLSSRGAIDRSLDGDNRPPSSGIVPRPTCRGAWHRPASRLPARRPGARCTPIIGISHSPWDTADQRAGGESPIAAVIPWSSGRDVTVCARVIDGGWRGLVAALAPGVSTPTTRSGTRAHAMRPYR